MNTDFAAQTQLVNLQGRMAQTQAYTDFAELDKIKHQAQSDGEGALREVAQQFESIFLNMVLKSMRAANEGFAEGGIFNSQQSKLYRDMYDQQVSLNLTKGPGIGMADMLVKQLGSFVERNQQQATPVEQGVNASSSLNNEQKQGLQTYKSLSQ